MLQMFTMSVSQLNHIFLGQFKRLSKVVTNNNYFTTSPRTLFHIVHNDYSTSSFTNNMQDLPLGNGLILNSLTSEPYNLRIRNNCSTVSYSGIIPQATLYNGRKHVACKIGHYQCYYGIRYLSTGVVPESTVAMQYSGIFKTLSESMPVKVAQDSLLWIHDYTALPWWSVIILTTIAMRSTVTLPLSLYQQYIFAKVENLQHEMKEIIKELQIETRYGIQIYNWSKKYARHLYNHSVKKQWNKLIVRENCHPAKTSILALVQIPLWVALSMSIRNLCYMLPKQDVSAYNTYQEFTNGGFLWITDLTVADPFVFPIIMGLCNLAIIEINYMNQKNEIKWKRYLTHFLRILTIGLIPIAMYVPSCVSLYWATSSAFGLFQNLILLSPKLRRFAGVPITASESQNPYAILRERIIARCRFKRGIKISSKV